MWYAFFFLVRFFNKSKIDLHLFACFWIMFVCYLDTFRTLCESTVPSYPSSPPDLTSAPTSPLYPCLLPASQGVCCAVPLGGLISAPEASMAPSSKGSSPSLPV